MAHDREVGGIRCTEVLALVGTYIDGEISPIDQNRVEAHLQGCQWCERFGGEYGALVGELQAHLPQPSTPQSARQLLDERLEQEPKAK